MAAYAALVSVMHIIDQIEHHPRPPISLDKTQVESLTKIVSFLQEFLEGYSYVGDSKEADGLESRIADAAYAAEDVIESHIVDRIHAGYKSRRTRTDHTSPRVEEEISSADLGQGLQRVIQDMDYIMKEAMEIKEKMGVQDHQHTDSSFSDGSLRSPTMGQNNTMVGFDDVLNKVMDKLTGQQDSLQIIPIVGMGGIGKTTLARNIYTNPVIVEHFDILAWVTISQEYSRREILLQVLCQKNKGGINDLSEDELGEMLHKDLSGRRYLIVMDDIWSIEAWDKVKFFFPNNNNGSRIMITTRLSNLAFELSGSNSFQMNFLDEDKSWNLLCRNVFGKEGCPVVELEETGKKIAKKCRGLPLSICVIGGLLTKSKRTREYWEYTSENLNSILNLENDELCLQILQTSYKELPVHLKPCFLYMGVFPEDSEICVFQLIELWVAEGFLKPLDGKSLEVVAEEYFKELIDRNLIVVHKLSSNGKAKLCKMHDLLRDLCIREARKQKFFRVLSEQSLNIPPDLNAERRIYLCESTTKTKHLRQVLQAWKSAPLARLKSASLVRSLIWQCREPPLSCRLLRVSSAVDNSFGYGERSLEAAFQQVNLRYLSVGVAVRRLSSSVSLLWNLQTLIVHNNDGVTTLSEIWKMPQLRHVEFSRGLYLPDPSIGNVGLPDDIVLENLVTLSDIFDFKCREQVVNRIPNIKKLKIRVYKESPYYWLNNIGHLRKLESLRILFSCHLPEKMSSRLTFPNSLKSLHLYGTHLHWEDMTTKIGSLPLLEVLKLEWNSFIGPKWETVEGQFYSLKFLLIVGCDDLIFWETECTHFPRLEHLVLRHLFKLKGIPSSIGDITTLQSIELEFCSNSAVISARKILNEQEEFGNDGLQVRVGLYRGIKQ